MTDTETTPGLRSVLGVLTRERLLDLGRVTGVGLSDVRSGNRRELASLLSAALGEARLPEVLRELGRDELRDLLERTLPRRRIMHATRSCARDGGALMSRVHANGRGA